MQFHLQGSTFTEQCRKYTVPLTLVVWIATIIEVTYVLVRDSSTTPALIPRLAQIVYIVVTPCWNLYAWRRPRVSNGQISFLYVAGVIGLTLSALMTERGRLMTTNITILLVGLLVLHPPYPVLHCSLLLPAYFITVYNMSFAGHGYPAALITPSETNLLVDLAAQMRTGFYVTMLLVLVHAQTVAYAKSVSKIQSTIEMTKAVSEELKQYRTEAARAVLDVYSTDNNMEIDNDVHVLLRSIINNLDSYRPYIPHYMLKSFEPDLPTVKNVEQTNDIINVLEPQLEETNVIVPSPMTDTISTSSSLGYFSTHRPVTYAMLQYMFVKQEDPRTLKHFVDTVYRCVGRFRGVVHSFLGNTIHVTWNGVDHCPHHARHATECGHYLNHKALRNQVTFHGGIMSGGAVCKMTGTQHQGFLMHVDWRDSLVLLFNSGRRVKSVVYCSETIKDIEPDRVMLVDIISSSRATMLNVYELSTSPQQHDLYSTELEEILNACKDGAFHDALSRVLRIIAKDEKTGNTSTPFCVFALKEKIMVCIAEKLQEGDFPSKPIP
eukprot:PhF_6_TR40825/c0_g1_i2/m.61780